MTLKRIRFGKTVGYAAFLLRIEGMKDDIPAAFSSSNSDPVGVKEAVGVGVTD
jgi:hypothetical protein